MKKIILASTSPRRKEILEQAGLAFSVIAPDCEENISAQNPADYVMQLSALKCRAGAEMLPENIGSVYVIGADTIVAQDDRILGKPEDQEDALKMLNSLNGTTHSVYTGVTVMDPAKNRTETFYEKTEVTFFHVSEEELKAYIATGEPMDKAGAYGIQGKGCFLVEKINGDYLNVVGLPAARLIRVLQNMNDE